MRQRRQILVVLFVICFILSYYEFSFAGVPIPWGAKLLRDDVVTTGTGEERKIASYETKASKEELFKYYLKEMPNRGYQLFMNGDYNIIFNNSDELVVIVAPPSPQSGKTTFMVSTAPMKNAPAMVNAEINCKPLPSVPVYPGARCTNSTRLKSGGSSSAAYSTEGSGKMVLDFYRIQMPQYGWQLEKEANLEEVITKAMQEQQKVAITPEQETAMRQFYGSAHGMFFYNQKGNGCSIHVMDNPIDKGGSLINIIYEEQTSKR